MSSAYGRPPNAPGARIRVATADDTSAVAALRREWTEERSGQVIDDPDFEANFVAWQADEERRRVTWLADVDDGTVGMLNMAVFTRMPRPRPEGGPEPIGQWGYIANMFVREAHRNGGVGALLIAAALEHADRENYARVVLTPTEQAVPFYARAGFVPATMLMVRPGRAQP